MRNVRNRKRGSRKGASTRNRKRGTISSENSCGQITTQLGTPRGRYDEHSSKFSLNKKPRFIEPVGKSQTSEGDVC
jgi:hypothetical protein